jgi:outer membrane protein assembly factor BamB
VTVCEARSSRIVGLDAQTGREVWTAKTAGEVRAIAGGTAVVVTAPGGGRPHGSLTAIDLRDGTARWTHDLPRHVDRALPCADSWVDASLRLVAVACNWDLTDYATVGEKQASAVVTYDLESGSTRQTHRYATAPITATAVFADGRVLVALIDEQQRWVAEVRNPQGDRHRETIAPYVGSHQTVRDLAVVGDQVLVIDGGAERLGCLR